MRIVGIDPGLTGALAVMEAAPFATIQDLTPMPILDKKVQGNQVADILRAWKPDMVVIEDLHAMPRGAIASFSLGWSCGVVTGVVQTLSYPFTRLRPNAWKMAVGLRGKDKNASRLLATELWPHWSDSFKLVRQDGNAEACLIAEAFRRKENL